MWRLPTIIVLSVLGGILLLLVAYITIHHVRLRRAILTNEWCVAFHDIHITEWLTKHYQHQWASSTSLKRDDCAESGYLSNFRTSSYDHALMVTSTLSIVESTFGLRPKRGVKKSLVEPIPRIVDDADGRAARVDKEAPHLSSIMAYGKWFERDVCVRRVAPYVFCGSRVCRQTKISVLQLRTRVVHPNVLRFFGLAYPLDDCLPLAVSEVASKGPLTDVLKNSHYKLDDNFKFAMALDVATGMAFLHGLDLVHGSLRLEFGFKDGFYLHELTRTWQNVLWRHKNLTSFLASMLVRHYSRFASSFFVSPICDKMGGYILILLQ